MPAPRKYQKKRNTTRKYKKRVYKKRAYKPRVKRATVRQMMPIAESRKYITQNLTPQVLAAGAHHNWQCFIPQSWLAMFREGLLETTDLQLTSTGFTGRTLFSRFVNQQIRVSFSSIEHIGIPVDLRVVYGYCKIPYQTALNSAGTAAANNVNGVLTGFKPKDMITQQLANQFDNPFAVNDPKKFKLFYNKRFQVKGTTIQAYNSPEYGTSEEYINRIVRKDLNYKISWKPNKKYHLIPVTTGDGEDGVGNPIHPDEGYPEDPLSTMGAFWTPNPASNGHLWTPFFAIEINNGDDYGRAEDGSSSTTSYPNVIHQDSHYFLDV